jgi:cold shock CspA family protein
MKGVLVTWFGGRGFGFLQPEDDGPDCLVHARNFIDSAIPREGETYQFDLRPNRKGYYRAEHVRSL